MGGDSGRLACQCCQPGWAALTLVIRFEMEQRDSRSEFSLSRSFSSLSLLSLSLSLSCSLVLLSLSCSLVPSLCLSCLPPSGSVCDTHALPFSFCLSRSGSQRGKEYEKKENGGDQNEREIGPGACEHRLSSSRVAAGYLPVLPHPCPALVLPMQAPLANTGKSSRSGPVCGYPYASRLLKAPSILAQFVRPRPESPAVRSRVPRPSALDPQPFRGMRPSEL